MDRKLCLYRSPVTSIIYLTSADWPDQRTLIEGIPVGFAGPEKVFRWINLTCYAKEIRDMMERTVNGPVIIASRYEYWVRTAATNLYQVKNKRKVYSIGQIYNDRIILLDYDNSARNDNPTDVIAQYRIRYSEQPYWVVNVIKGLTENRNVISRKLRVIPRSFGNLLLSGPKPTKNEVEDVKPSSQDANINKETSPEVVGRRNPVRPLDLESCNFILL